MSGPRFFGTDGVRGLFGRPPLDETTVRRLGAALAADLADRFGVPCVVLGGDTRDSTPILCRWLAEELRARGVDLIFLGTITTPGVTHTVLDRGASCGIAVSASHNPHPDNGIKLIDHRGFKWSPRDEERLEAAMDQARPASPRPTVELEVDSSAVDAYLRAITLSVDDQAAPALDGLRIALDTGHGAASPFAQRLFGNLGAEVVVIHDEPDGVNINLDSGSTHPEHLADAVRRHQCQLGFAFDGDADRALLVDAEGTVRDGDAILYLWASDLAAREALPHSAIVATSMSNLGLEVGLRRKGIEVVRCGVGDREVVTTMVERGLALGGEQSGHIVQTDLSTTGDGLLTAVQVAHLVKRSGQSVEELLDGFERFPQLLHNLPVARKPPLDELPAVREAAREVEAVLGDEGRLVLRYSGTEPLVRIMIEGPDQERIEQLAQNLASVLAKEIGR